MFLYYIFPKYKLKSYAKESHEPSYFSSSKLLRTIICISCHLRPFYFIFSTPELPPL